MKDTVRIVDTYLDRYNEIITKETYSLEITQTYDGWWHSITRCNKCNVEQNLIGVYSYSSRRNMNKEDFIDYINRGIPNYCYNCGNKLILEE